VLGTPTDTIRAAEDRDIFKEKLEEIGEKMAPSIACNTLEEVPPHTIPGYLAHKKQHPKLQVGHTLRLRGYEG